MRHAALTALGLLLATALPASARADRQMDAELRGVLAETAQNRPDLPQIVAQLRQSIAQNQAELRQYSWTETTEISIKSETKKRDQKECHYAADGTLQKTPVGSPPEPRNAPRGVKGKIVANKVEDMQQYLDRVGSLVRRYVPPDPQAMKAAFDAGKASVGKGSEGAFASVVFRDYAKPGDEVTLLLDPKTKKLRTFRDATYLDAPGDVSLDASFPASKAASVTWSNPC